ncbi:DUF5131 family protein [Paenibacillus tianjinensis]|uniref:DUF5131 family protein n=1 Tax=Paenibacillus tianjinensis TaxID=2810347 RepID=A0ABX7LM86_9BACL|nr:DUF5131 family protein [Paenibacillus tianjinensis]
MVQELRDQCQIAGVPFFFKQWGEWQDTYIFFHSVPCQMPTCQIRHTEVSKSRLNHCLPLKRRLIAS